MNIESELKLIPTKGITQEQIIEILRKNGIVVSEKGKVIHQQDTYFDDKDGTLEKTGGSFRIRRKNDKTQVTYKIPIESNTEYKQRREYEIVVPEEYKQNIDMKLAVKLLKEQYPELTFPENMDEIVTVINNRNKTNLTCPDGTVLEMAFDTLQGKDGEGNLYYISPEIEFEKLSGNSDNLTDIYETVVMEFPGQTKRNFLSKYARTKRDIELKKLTVDEISACAMFSEILNSIEFNKLQYKGQILHRYDKPTFTNLDNFKNFDYLVETLKKLKSGQYKLPIPKAVAEKSEITELLEGENYEVRDEINLEEMTCLLLSDVKYRVADEVLADFLNKKYYGLEHAMTNRLSHSQQVMLGTGLICKSSQVGADLGERLTSMISAISHDIGHVPMSHTLEMLLKEIDGIFTHDANGERVIDNIYENNRKNMVTQVKQYFPELSEEQIEESLERKKGEIALAVASHSRKNCDERGRGINVQAPRAADKILYVASDTCDLIRYAKNIQGIEVDVFDNEWIDEAIREFCKEKEYLFEPSKELLEKQYIPYLKKGDYGRAVVNAINSLEANLYGRTIYYEADPKIWGFIEQLIKRIKDVRENMGIEEAKVQMTNSAMSVIVEEFYKIYIQKNRNIDLAWEELHDKLTKMGELDLIDYIRQNNKFGGLEKVLKGEEKVTPKIAEQIVQKMQQRVYEINKIKGIKEEQAQKEADNIGKHLEQLTPEQVLLYFRRYKFAENLPIENIFSQLHARTDVQLKIQPTADMSISKMLRDLKLQQIEYQNLSDTIDQFQDIVDQYYRVKQDKEGKKRVIAKVRQISGEDFKTLVVKIEVKKKVSERIAKQYKVKCPLDSTINEMVQKLNEENIGLDVELVEEEPYEEIRTERTNYIREYGADQVVFSIDSFKGKEGPEMQEIEIKCKDNPRTVSKIKTKLKKTYGKEIFVKGSKIDRVQKVQEKGWTFGE